MRVLRTITASIGALCLTGAAAFGCGGTDEQPEMPDPSVVDRSADDMGLPQAEPGSETQAPPENEAASDEGPQRGPVRVVAGERETVEGGAPSVRILEPHNNQRIASGNVTLRLQVRNWELQPDPGRHVHVIVDNDPYIAVRDASQPLNLNQLVQETNHHELAQGTHVLRVFPSSAHHESVKSRGAFQVIVFTYGQPTRGFQFNARAPLLTYSRPKGCYRVGDRVLLDFYLTNATLAQNGMHVRYDVDGTSGEITEWAPLWIEGLSAGEHRVQLSLVDAHGQPVAGPFNDTQRTIRIARSCE
jgi:hypothetical protein